MPSKSASSANRRPSSPPSHHRLSQDQAYPHPHLPSCYQPDLSTTHHSHLLLCEPGALSDIPPPGFGYLFFAVGTRPDFIYRQHSFYPPKPGFVRRLTTCSPRQAPSPFSPWMQLSANRPLTPAAPSGPFALVTASPALSTARDPL